MNHDEIVKKISSIVPDLGDQMLRAANYIIGHPDLVAVYSMRELARRIDVPPVTLVRLAQRLGLPGYGVLRRQFVQALLEDKNEASSSRSRSTKSARAIMASAAAEANSIKFAQAFFEGEAEILRRTLAGLTQDRLTSVATILAKADNVFVIGRRTSFAPAFTLAYTLSKARAGVHLLDDSAGAPESMLEDVGGKDVLVGFTFAPFSRVTDTLARRAAAEGATIVGISDSLAAPIRNLSGDLFFLAPTSSRSFPESLSGAMIMASLLTALVVAELGEPAGERILKNEKFLMESSEYILTAKRSRRRTKSPENP